jgi:spermidine synthase
MERYAGGTSTPWISEALNAHCGTYTVVGSRLTSATSPYQTVDVIDTPQYGRILRLDGYTMTSERDDFYYHENLVHVGGIAHPAPAKVLIVGGGDGGAAREVLRHPSVAQVDLVEIDAMVLEHARRYLPTVHGGAFDDPRLALHVDDGKAWLERSCSRYDWIVLDLTDPIGPAHALYTVEFYRTCRSRLAPGGLLSLHIESPVYRPKTCLRILRTLEAVFPCVRPYLVFVPTYGAQLAMVTASLDIDPARLSEAEVARRLQARGIADLRYYNAATHRAGFALPNVVRTLFAGEAEIVSADSTRLDADAELSSDGYRVEIAAGEPPDATLPATRL